MKKSTVHFSIELDDNNIPEKIHWDATDKPEAGPSETKSISVALWDHQQNNTLRIDLWTKDMPVPDMKRFYVDCLGGLAQSALASTGDEYISSEINSLCEKLITYLRKAEQRS
jgi:gliding motility-associated protein GldC